MDKETSTYTQLLSHKKEAFESVLMKCMKPEPIIQRISPGYKVAADAVVVVWSLSRVRLFATPWTAARQASHPVPEFAQVHVR